MTSGLVAVAAWAAVRVSQVLTYQAPSGLVPGGGGAEVANGAHGHGGGVVLVVAAACVVEPPVPETPG